MYFCNMIFRHLLNMRSHPTWVRGLKLSLVLSNSLTLRVAPYVGAWIETTQAVGKDTVFWSHPTWVRGLKLQFGLHIASLSPSHPTWVRGLKLGSRGHSISKGSVAPYVGAWIETTPSAGTSEHLLCRTLRGCVD